MDEQPRGSMSTVTVSIIGAIMLLAGYILSPMPAYVLCNQTGLSDSDWMQSAFETAYTPIFWAAEKSPVVSAFYQHQEELCERIGLVP